MTEPTELCSIGSVEEFRAIMAQNSRTVWIEYRTYLKRKFRDTRNL